MSFPLEEAFDLLNSAHQSSRLAHAYLITGSEGSGKQELARKLICLINKIEETDSYQSLESLKSGTVNVIGPESKSRRITIDGIRGAEKSLHMVSQGDLKKIVVIKEADRMLPAASNAFLKTLEEPPDNSILLLLTAQPEQLLSTILSRCIRISLKGNAEGRKISNEAEQFLDQLRNFFNESRQGVSSALSLMKVFSGILSEKKSRISKRNDEALKQEIKTYKQTTEGDWLKGREAYYKAVSESEYLEFRSKLIEYLLAWFGDSLRQQNGWNKLDLQDYADTTRRLAEQLDSAALNKKMDAIESLQNNLNTNVQEALALESAFIKAFA